jgi:predicted ester cyclase
MTSTRWRLNDIEPTGKPFAMKTAHFFRSRDGRLCEHWGIRDELDVLYQVGALTPPEMTTPAQD